MRIERYEHYEMSPLEGNGDKQRSEPVVEFRASVVLWVHRTKKNLQDKDVSAIADRHLYRIQFPEVLAPIFFQASESYAELIARDPKLFAKWVKNAAETMEQIIQSERLDKRDRAFWEAAKEAFQMLIKKIQSAE